MLIKPPFPHSRVSDHTDWSDPAVRHHLTRLAQVSQATASAIVITNAAGVTEWVNDGFIRITGYGFDEAVGKTPGELLQGADTDANETARIGAALRARHSVAAELINYAKDGRRYWVGMKIEPLYANNGELDGFMAIEAEITDRHEQSKAMRQLARRFDLATRAARVGVFERNVDWEILWWNPMMWELFGQDAATFRPSNEAWLSLIHREDRERIRAELVALKSNPGSIILQYRIIRPDGELRHIKSIGAAADHNHESGRCIAGIVIDNTERVQATERELALERRLRDSAHQAGMAEIATGVLHNVGNILNSLGIANSTARRELKSLRLDRLEQASALLLTNRGTLAVFLTDDEHGRHLADYLPALSTQMSTRAKAMRDELDTTERLLRHLSDIVSAQQELGRVGGQYEPIHLKDLVETALLMHAGEYAQIEIVREYAELPLVMSDRHKLLQILVNLISNARDALQAGPNDHPRIIVKLARSGDRVQVTIEDSGIGMSAEVLSKLWQYGFTTKKSGHGFGLHNSANVAHAIDATLTAESDGLGHGSRFILTVPIQNSHTVLAGEAA